MEAVTVGMTEGNGSLSFQGQGRSYPFVLIGSVVGPGGASKLDVVGKVYTLNNLSDFEGLYAEGTGQAGLDTSNQADLWLQNEAGAEHPRQQSSKLFLTKEKTDDDEERSQDNRPHLAGRNTVGG